MKFCKYCGNQEQDDDARFCEKCGKPFLTESSSIQNVTPKTASNTNSVTMNKEELENFATKNVLFSPSVTQLSNIRSRCNIPKQENIIAIIDNTVFGSAKAGIAITAKGMYHKADFDTPFFVSWKELTTYSLETGFLCVKFLKNGDKKFEFDTAGGDMGASELLTFLHEIQEYLDNKGDELFSTQSSNNLEDSDFPFKETGHSTQRLENLHPNYYDLPLEQMLNSSPLNRIFHFDQVANNIKNQFDQAANNIKNQKNWDENNMVSLMTDFFTISMLDFFKVNKNTVNSKLLRFAFGDPSYYFLISSYLEYSILKWIGKYAQDNFVPIDKVLMLTLGLSETMKETILSPVLKLFLDQSDSEREEFLNDHMKNINDSFHEVIADIIGEDAIKSGIFTDYNYKLKTIISNAILAFIKQEEQNWKDFISGMFE